jgi:proteasome accessory factor C
VSGATDHLPRLLALVPWLLAHPGTSVQDVAREFGVSEQQVRADIDLVWMCGLPGYGPGDLIDVVWEGERISLSNADTIERPLRLTGEEALALVAALRALSGVPGIVDTQAVDRALAKVEAAAGGTGAAERVLAAEPGVPHGADSSVTDSGVVGTVADAMARGRRLHLSYWVPARDETTERDVDPIRLITSAGAAYLVGWCHRVDDLRTFRLDRVLAATVLDTPAEPPPEASARTSDDELFHPAPTDRLVTLELAAPARWIADYYPCEQIDERPDGGLRVRLRSRDEAWVRRLGLGLAGLGRVVDPPDLVDAVHRSAEAALAGYR